MSHPVIPIAAKHDDAPGFPAPPPLALYVHIPWCVRKCPYCDFNSHELRGVLPQAEYIAALIADLEAALPQIWGRPVSSIFIGGGTPSLFMPEAFDTLLAAVRARVSLLPDAEITLEANPGTVEARKFEGFRAAGINRISLGIQSFDDIMLQALGRIHSADEAKRAIDMAQRHFDNINLDLMYGLPQQTLEQAQRDVETALGFATMHLSAYHLTLEPNTPFHHAPPPLPDDDLCADMQEMVEAVLAAAGHEHYETSAFARPNWRCRHNLNYWTFGDYLGIGAGAHGKLTSHLGVVRETRRKQPRDYLQAAARGEFALERRSVGGSELPFEFMMNALRLCEGFPPRLYAERTGLALAGIQNLLLAAQDEGLLKVSAEHIAPTVRGQRFLNALLRRFLPGDE
ncbi:putative oxidoreductase [Georgfuchsia toluolica]|uniref:Heme chaperone HemW n=1 Tax=Georgfuchsia toluolica TaxID=424218 RepID=A0A916N3C4_9PROT|nr:radical SAM family heme chaperone HemW [Georgfuchsia toluolica]CAG4884861.1 putative oxidoreductase [Georgfuchsia toluolica]